MSVEALYGTYGPMVFRRCLSILRDQEAAYDATQEVFVKLLDSPRTLERVQSPVSYLYRMATNTSLNELKRRRRRAPAAGISIEELGRGDEREDAFAAEYLLELLASSFGERTRTIAYCRYADGMGLDEIADFLEVSRSTVRKHLDAFKARARKHKERIV